jgi:hypothetical protein
MTNPSARRAKPAGAGERRFLEELDDKRQDVRDVRRALNRIEPESPAWNAAAQRVLAATGEQLDFEDRAAVLRPEWDREQSMGVLGWIIGAEVVWALVCAVLAGLGTVGPMGWWAALAILVVAVWTGVSRAVARVPFSTGIVASAIAGFAGLVVTTVMMAWFPWPVLALPVVLVAVVAFVLQRAIPVRAVRGTDGRA